MYKLIAEHGSEIARKPENEDLGLAAMLEARVTAIIHSATRVSPSKVMGGCESAVS